MVAAASRITEEDPLHSHHPQTTTVVGGGGGGGGGGGTPLPEAAQVRAKLCILRRG
jgi:hypothetical protein